MVTVDDNMGAGSVPFAGLYTNFGDTPDNLFYANNFDGLQQMSTSYYEWNARIDDVVFDNDGALTWDVASRYMEKNCFYNLLLEYENYFLYYLLKFFPYVLFCQDVYPN